MAKFWQEFGPVTVDLTKQWKSAVVSQPVHKQFKTVQLVAFSQSGLNWGGASVIAYEFTASLGDSFTVRLPFDTPSLPNYVLAVRFGSPLQRYKFWEGVGEDLNYPLYNGETIEGDCVFEVWTVEGSTVVSNGQGMDIGISLTFNRSGCSATDLSSEILTELIQPLGSATKTVTLNTYSPAPLPLVFT